MILAVSQHLGLLGMHIYEREVPNSKNKYCNSVFFKHSENNMLDIPMPKFLPQACYR